MLMPSTLSHTKRGYIGRKEERPHSVLSRKQEVRVAQISAPPLMQHLDMSYSTHTTQPTEPPTDLPAGQIIDERNPHP